MADTTRLPDGGVSLDPRDGVLPVLPATASGAIVRDPTSGRLVRWDGAAWADVPSPVATIGGILTVAAGGGAQYTTIAAALAVAVSGDVVLVYPGTYPESGLSIPAGVRLSGFPAPQNTIISGADTTTTRVTLETSSTLRDITVTAPSVGANPGVLVDVDAAELAVLVNVVMIAAGGTGPLIRKQGAGLLAALEGLFHNGGATTGAFVEVTAGRAIVKQLIANVGSSLAVLRITGGRVEAQTWFIQSSALYACTDGFRVEGGAIQLNSFQTPQPTPAATNLVHIMADGVEVDFSDAHLHGATYDMLVDGGLVGTGTSINFNGCDFRIEKASAPAAWWTGAILTGVTVDTGILNDTAVRMLETAVGLHSSPAELAVGTGDSLVPLSVWTYDASAGTYTDVTEAAQSRSGSTFQFPGDVGDKLYIGYNVPFVNVRTNQTIAAVLGAGSVIQAQIWTGAAYEDIRVLASNASSPYQQRGDNVFTDGANEQIRVDIEGDADPTSGTNGEPFSNWATEDPMAGGTAYYYLSFVVENTNLTTPATFERLKVGLARTEINGDGFVESFGTGEGERKALTVSPRRNFTGGGAPGTATFALSASVTVSVPSATFANNAVEGFVQTYNVVRGIDSSRMLRFDVDWTVSGAVVGNVELELTFMHIRPADNIDAGTLAETSFAKVTTITAATDNGVLNTTSFYFAEPDMLPGDEIAVTLFRDATAGNPDDTLAGSIKIWNTALRAVRWTGN